MHLKVVGSTKFIYKKGKVIVISPPFGILWVGTSFIVIDVTAPYLASDASIEESLMFAGSVIVIWAGEV